MTPVLICVLLCLSWPLIFSLASGHSSERTRVEHGTLTFLLLCLSWLCRSLAHCVWLLGVLYIDLSPLFNRNSCSLCKNTHIFVLWGGDWNQIMKSDQISQCHLIQVENDSNLWARISSQLPPLISAQLKVTLTLLLFFFHHFRGFTVACA